MALHVATFSFLTNMHAMSEKISKNTKNRLRSTPSSFWNRLRLKYPSCRQICSPSTTGSSNRMECGLSDPKIKCRLTSQSKRYKFRSWACHSQTTISFRSRTFMTCWPECQTMIYFAKRQKKITCLTIRACLRNYAPEKFRLFWH